MLVADWIRRRADRDERGAVLVTVVVVMFVGFIIASIIAAAVMFTIRANDDNRDNLDAFVAAESGRDAALAAVATSCSITGAVTGTSPEYSATVYTTASTTVPTSHDDATLDADTCPTEATEFILINSVGTGPDGSTAEIDSVYRWVKTLEETPGGTLAYFAGNVGGQKSIYDGDLVVRKGDYTCPNEAVINGDLYVVNGTVSLSTSCHVTGSIYSYGEVASNSQLVRVDGDIVTEVGDVDLSNNGVVITGDIHAGANVDLHGSGGTNGQALGDVRAAGTIDISDGWDEVPPERTFEGAGAPDFNPTLEDVYSMTAWIDFGKDSWGADDEITSGCLKNPTASQLRGTGRLLIDYTQCSGNSVTITIPTLEVNRDVVFVVPAQKTMKVKFDGNVTRASGVALEAAPQLVFVHEDRNLSYVDGEPAPTCESTGPDDLTTANGVTSMGARVMIYSPCTIGGTVRVDYAGQFYTAGNSVNFNNGASINCKPMSWTPVFEEISCRIETDEDSVPTTVVQSLGDRLFQTER
ncbi:hypothetical protein [Microbacterium thalassium]|uniref:Uncharacterized protein n=1 Tax=Microbacterium thalassium TaxID=362649 RepID=A0A7X0FQ52_9MICO|nr:hypothetical protein [Microbacterium thalassium]MBB6391633.1 hypothetical protein [Microbacterium thalassium]GLK24236.1 hypothetical protein GCM10017607_15540 [Microbacterium thalassium]